MASSPETQTPTLLSPYLVERDQSMAAQLLSQLPRPEHIQATSEITHVRWGTHIAATLSRQALSLSVRNADRSLTAVLSRQEGAAARFYGADALGNPLPEGHETLTAEHFKGLFYEAAALTGLSRQVNAHYDAAQPAA